MLITKSLRSKHYNEQFGKFHTVLESSKFVIFVGMFVACEKRNYSLTAKRNRQVKAKTDTSN